MANCQKGRQTHGSQRCDICFQEPYRKIVTVYNRHQPALKMENYFEDVCKVLDKLTNNRAKDFTMNLKTMLYMSVLMNNYRHEIVSKKPPDAAIRLLSCIGKMIGINY